MRAAFASAATSMGVAAPRAARRPVMTPLSLVVDADAALPVVTDDAALARLLPLLPEGQRTVGDLRDIVHGPQFRQTLGSLSHALNTENMQSVFANFGLRPTDGADALARGDGIAAFLDAIQAEARRATAAPAPATTTATATDAGSGSGSGSASGSGSGSGSGGGEGGSSAAQDDAAK